MVNFHTKYFSSAEIEVYETTIHKFNSYLYKHCVSLWDHITTDFLYLNGYIKNFNEILIEFLNDIDDIHIFQKCILKKEFKNSQNYYNRSDVIKHLKDCLYQVKKLIGKDQLKYEIEKYLFNLL